VPATPPSGGSCVDVSVDGGGAFECNPVTNEPCSTGEECDRYEVLGTLVGFVCWPPPNPAKLCQYCDPTSGPQCAGGLTCTTTFVCVRYCCTDADCGAGKCDRAGPNNMPLFTPLSTTLGICIL
jgi:hypothetical protein